MDKLARLRAEDRRDIFLEAAAQLGMSPAIVEKDFWVCMTLKLLFEKSPFGKSLVFKGGTSLSKAHKLIKRFSEDIDLVLDWEVIGFSKKFNNPMQDFTSKCQQDQFNKQINRLAAEYLAATLCPNLESLLSEERIGLSATIDVIDPHTVIIRYPAAFAETYIRPEVRLEIGPLASWVPSAKHVITPYAVDALPHLFENPSCQVLVIAAERTFWEKATILHQEAHREAPIPHRYSRHYYDLYKLASSPIRTVALANLPLLEDVVAFKRRFYPSNWARYGLAVPGTFKLIPGTDSQISRLEQDYADMQIMLFGPAPEFDEILEKLRRLEADINALV